MRKFITLLILSFWVYHAQSQTHKLNGYISPYASQQFFYNNEDTNTVYTTGLKYTLEHAVGGLRWVGSNISLQYDFTNKAAFEFGLSFRLYFYNDFLRVEFLPPTFYYPINNYYQVNPWGMGFTFGRQRARFYLKMQKHNKEIRTYFNFQYKIHGETRF